MRFRKCDICADDGLTLCPSCRYNRDVINKLNQRISELKHEIKVDNELLATRNRLLHAVPECPAHGNECVPHAIEWVNRIKMLGEIVKGMG